MNKQVKKYWIVVISKEHALLAIENKIIQVCHGKKAPLSRMSKGDIFFIYSPNLSLHSNQKYQKITACGMISDNHIYQYNMFENFKPFRRKVKFYKLDEVEIETLRTFDGWEKYKQSLRYGIFEIDQTFAKQIYEAAKK